MLSRAASSASSTPTRLKRASTLQPIPTALTHSGVMANSADGSDLWHGEVEPRSDLAKRFRAGEQILRDV